MGSKMPQRFQSCTDFMVESCLCRLCHLTNFAMLQNSSERRASCLPDVTRIQRHWDTSCGQRVALVQNESAHLEVGTKERGKCWRLQTSTLPRSLGSLLPSFPTFWVKDCHGKAVAKWPTTCTWIQLLAASLPQRTNDQNKENEWNMKYEIIYNIWKT